MSVFEAVEKRDLSTLKSILSYTNSNILKDDLSPLMYASYWGLFDIIEALIVGYIIFYIILELE